MLKKNVGGAAVACVLGLSLLAPSVALANGFIGGDSHGADVSDYEKLYGPAPITTDLGSKDEHDALVAANDDYENAVIAEYEKLLKDEETTETSKPAVEEGTQTETPAVEPGNIPFAEGELEMMASHFGMTGEQYKAFLSKQMMVKNAEKKLAEAKAQLDAAIKNRAANFGVDPLGTAAAVEAAQKNYNEALAYYKAATTPVKGVEKFVYGGEVEAAYNAAAEEAYKALAEGTEATTDEATQTEDEAKAEETKSEAKAEKKAALPKTADVVSVISAVSTAVAGAGALIAGRRQ